jgi:outer membrane protein assembly factor BamB
MHRLPTVALTVLLSAGAAAALQAALPTFWQVSTESEFLRGEFENLSIDSYGRLTLGPTATPLYDTNAPFIWTLIAGQDGNVFAGSGNDGQVFKIDASGKATSFFDAEELEVHALAAGPNGSLYVGTSPDGRIYRVDASGKGAVFFDPDDRYIWSLAVDPKGVVYAATGDKGVIYRITPDGKGAPFYQTKATHVMTLAFDGQGRLLAGTESPGRVFQIDAAGKPFVLLDSGYNEIHKLRVGRDGAIYAAAVRGRTASRPADTDQPSSGADAAPTPIATVSTEITGVSVVVEAASPATTTQPRTPLGPGSGAIFRIGTDGASDLLWESREDTPYDIAFDGERDILVATGNRGKIYRLSGDPYQPALLTRANAEQVTTIVPDRDGRVMFATSNPGKLFRLASDRADKGTYTSDVRDAQTVATWGALRWQASVPSGTRVEISTRSGNTRTPDETWSEWSSPYNDRDGSAITSPRARYLQWRAVLTGGRGEGPLLTSVTAAYLPRNIRPRVTSITIHPPGTIFQRQYPVDPEIAGFEGDTPDRRALARSQGAQQSVSLGRRSYEKGLLTFVWRAEDDNRDTLSYDIFYRREGETAWKPLKRALADQILVWDTTSVPNGRYVIRVVASDAESNSPSTTLTGAMESMAFDVDNAPPAINVGSVRRDAATSRTTITFEVRDADSAVQKVEYSLDGDRWLTVYPRDGIADSRLEQFELVLEGSLGARGVIVRATDSLNNVSSSEVATPNGTAPSNRR